MIEYMCAMSRAKIGDEPGREEDFKKWVMNRKEGNSQGTANTYWNQVKDKPKFNLIEEHPRLIRNRMEGTFSKEHEVVCLRQYVEYKFERKYDAVKNGEFELDYLINNIGAGEILEGFRYNPKNDDGSIKPPHQISKEDIMEMIDTTAKNKQDIFDTVGGILKEYKNNIQDNLELKESEKGGDDGPNIKYHFMEKDKLIQLLDESNPTRAKFWATLYFLGCRKGELKRLQWSDVDLEYGDHGKVTIPDEKSKSKDERQINLENPYTAVLLQKIFAEGDFKSNDEDAGYYGDWTDDDGNQWEDVAFPERDGDKENYELGKVVERNGDDKEYGLALRKTDISKPRTLHSFRHTRITDLVKASDRDVDYVKDRAGHKDLSTTNDYTETSFVKPPKTLEQYMEQKHGEDWQVELDKIIESDGK